MPDEPDIQQIKREILERAIFHYETRIADLKGQIDQFSLTTKNL
ncbi:hypothetical protein ACKUB1_08615 [Methanospirillum stamsii]|nr:hypothetical protein [Methanospirillum stamsii]